MQSIARWVAAACCVLAPAGPVSAELINGGFETQTPPVAPGTFAFLSPGNVPGWTSTALQGAQTGIAGVIEIWGTGFLGVPAFEGTHFAELNADAISTIFQEVSGIAAGREVGFEFAHRARGGQLVTDVDVMRLTITDLGSDEKFGTGDDTLLFTKLYADNNRAWGYYTNAGEPPIVTLGHTMRFAYEAVSTASGHDQIGNFLDQVNFGIGVGASSSAVSEPATLVMLATTVAMWGSRRAVRRRRGQG